MRGVRLPSDSQTMSIAAVRTSCIYAGTVCCGERSSTLQMNTARLGEGRGKPVNATLRMRYETVHARDG